MIATKQRLSRVASSDGELNKWVEGRLKELGINADPGLYKDFPGYPNYIRAKLKQAGFKGQELEDLTQKIFVRLLVAPEGNFEKGGQGDTETLFEKWDTSIGVPFVGFFTMAAKRQVANEIARRSRDTYADPTKGVSIQPGGRDEGSEMKGISEETLIDTRTPRSLDNEEHFNHLNEKFRAFLKQQRDPYLLKIYDFMTKDGEFRDQTEGVKEFGMSPGQFQPKMRQIQELMQTFAQQLGGSMGRTYDRMEKRRQERVQREVQQQTLKDQAKSTGQVYVDPTKGSMTWTIKNPAKHPTTNAKVPAEELKKKYGDSVHAVIKRRGNHTHRIVITDGPHKGDIWVVDARDLS